jgi:hypothetical protein
VHWIAHQLAEHLLLAETADSAEERDGAREAASLLIAQLWRARGGWPEGWPPDAVRQFAEGVRYATGSRPQEQRQLPPWVSSLAEHAVLQWEEQAAWTYAALLEVGDTQLQRALDVAPDPAPEPSDLDEIRWQLSRYEEAAGWIADHAQEGEDPSRRKDRAEILSRVLEDISERRAALIERTIRDTRGGQRRKPSPGAGRPASPGRRVQGLRAR